MATTATTTTTAANTTSEFIVLLVTCPDEDVAKEVARALLEGKLAACVNIVPRMTSMYWWEGKICEDTEHLLIIKSKSTLFDELTQCVKAMHPAQVPEVISLGIEQGSKDYLSWISQVTKQ